MIAQLKHARSSCLQRAATASVSASTITSANPMSFEERAEVGHDRRDRDALIDELGGVATGHCRELADPVERHAQPSHEREDHARRGGNRRRPYPAGEQQPDHDRPGEQPRRDDEAEKESRPPRAVAHDPHTCNPEEDEEGDVSVCESGDDGRAREGGRVAAPVAHTAQVEGAGDSHEERDEPDDDGDVVGQRRDRKRGDDRGRRIDPAVVLVVDGPHRVAAGEQLLSGLPDRDLEVAEQLVHGEGDRRSEESDRSPLWQ